MTLQALETAGFPKAHVNSYSAFDRILSGIAWLLQRIVRREDAEKCRVQWDVLYHPHDKMKPRLELVQEVVRCVEALDYACPVAIQPHQLLLQDFSDIKTVQKLVLWLIDEGQLASHCEKIRRERAFLQIMGPQKERKHVTGVKTDVERLLDVYAPKRRWQYVAIAGKQEESEDALIQRCLLEYGERVLVADNGDIEVEMDTREEDELPIDFVAQMASQAAAVARSGTMKPQGKFLSFNRRRLKRSDRRAEKFGRHYQAAADQAREEQQTLLRRRREREAKLLQRLVSAPDEKERDSTNGRVEASEESMLQSAIEKLKKHEQELIEEKKHLYRKVGTCNSQAAALDEAFLALKLEVEVVEVQTPKDSIAVANLAKLWQLMKQKEEHKQEKVECRAKCRLELETLKDRVEKLKRQVAMHENKQDDRALGLLKMEEMHAQMALKHKELKHAAAQRTRAVYRKLKQIDEIPSRIELVQYEKRFVELYDEVALTLDETRKYYCVYNTLKTTHDILEKKISLINSISENFEVAMDSKTATQAFFVQVENIIENVQGLVRKQQAARDDFQSNVDILDSKYQLVLEHDRMYTNAIHEFQKECEKHEKLSLRLEKMAQL
uniref:Uncharacterized protein n=1 Tax=Hyaloperonospora arabidopsidis (strain Emoy2) TaxID=559515 RepID=M4BGA0_HYAAE